MVNNFLDIENDIRNELKKWNSKSEIEENYNKWNPIVSCFPEPKKLTDFLINIQNNPEIIKGQYLTPKDLNSNSKFINIEGIDNSGKTTCINYIKNNLFSDYILTTEPTYSQESKTGTSQSWIGKQVRKSIKNNKTDPLIVFYLFLADHICHLKETIYPALMKDKNIICDRYIFSRYAYQSLTLKNIFDKDALKSIQNIQENGFWTIMPTKTIYIDITAEESIKRMSGERETFENKDFLEKTRKKYLNIIEEYPNIFTKINGMKNKEEIFTDLEKIIND